MSGRRARVMCALLAGVLGAAPLAAQAAQWAKVNSAGGADSYVDKSSMIKVDKNWKAWSLVSYSTEQTTAEGTAYMSVKALKLYVCAERTATLLNQVYYAEPMGKGSVVQSFRYEKFTPDDIVPDSAEDGAFQLLCKGKITK